MHHIARRSRCVIIRGMTDVDTLERASALLRAGEPIAGAAICGAILAREPRNAIAAHLLGLALKDTGDWSQGERWLRFSIEIEPDRGEFHANLGNLLRKSEQYVNAESAYRRALQLLPHHRAARRGLAQTLNDLNRPGEAESHCRELLASDAGDGEAWEILALALTALGRTVEAEAAHRQAIALNPADAIAHHNLGALLVSMKRPEAMKSLQTARGLGIEGYNEAYNRGGAALNLGDLEGAEAAFARAVELQPLDPEAQRMLARTRFMRGDPAFARSLATAMRANRDNMPLQSLLAELLWHAGDLSSAETLLRDALGRAQSGAARSMLAMVLLDQGRLEEAETEALEAAAAKPGAPLITANLVAILIARGRAEEAMPFIEVQLQRDPFAQEWLAYEATAARMLGASRYRELYDYDALVRTFDIAPPPGFASISAFNLALAGVLNETHGSRRELLDQTVRNGTQSLRSLLADSSPVVRAALKALRAPIDEYCRALALNDRHPLARIRAGEVRFTGAWSVRLQRGGHHVNHVHPAGIVSSAYYIEVPEEMQDAALKSGWLKFGEPRYPAAGLGPEHFVQPRPGRLVLFPSYMWHGTNAIYGAAHCLSLAFDIAI